MSNYSDFFGVGSSGGGGGIPINSYAPYLVTATTGNPVGYDATTGLYTHPDGTFWLETGKTITTTTTSTPDPTYPDATYSSVKTFDLGAGSNSFTAQGRGGNTIRSGGIGRYGITRLAGGNIYYHGADSDGKRMFQAASPSSAIGRTTNSIGGSTPLGELIGARDINALWFLNGSNILQYNTTFGYQGTTIPLSDGATPDWGAYLPNQDKFYMWDNAGSTILITEYDNTGTITGNTISVTHPNGGANTYLTIRPDLDAITAYQATGQFAYYTLSGYTATLSATSTITGTNYIGSSNNFQYDASPSFNIISWQQAAIGFNSYQSYGTTIVGKDETQITVGDGTARTDTDTSQPLFVRLK